MDKKIVWTIAGSDNSGGAGIQADFKTLHSFGVYACSIITAITAQNSQTVSQVKYISASIIHEQIKSLAKEFFPEVIKIGMLGQAEVISTLLSFLKDYEGKLIVDPVLASSTGQLFIQADENTYVDGLKQLFPYVDLLTPNIFEAEKLLHFSIHTYDDMESAAKQFLALGVKSVLMKGGHYLANEYSEDYWTNGKEAFWLTSKRYPEKNYRGTGCVLSSAIAAALALSYDIKDALVIAKMYVNRGIRQAQSINKHTAILAHGDWPNDEVDLPYVSSEPIQKIFSFPECDTTELGLYPVVDNSEWLEKLLPLGVTTLQLRVKNKTGAALENEIKKSIAIAKHYQARLFINDYWQLALAHGAYGVHLGQEDLFSADLAQIQAAGLRLGISTHCYYEMARAHRYHPSYMACGPIFTTTSKQMAFAPLGIQQLKKFTHTLKNYPVVAIGGIGQDNISAVRETGVSGIAMISAITRASNPETSTVAFLSSWSERK